MKSRHLLLTTILAASLCFCLGCGRQSASNVSAPAKPSAPRMTAAELRAKLSSTQAEVGALVSKISQDIESEDIDAARTADEVERKIAEVRRLREQIQQYRATSKRSSR